MGEAQAESGSLLQQKRRSHFRHAKRATNWKVLSQVRKDLQVSPKNLNNIFLFLGQFLNYSCTGRHPGRRAAGWEVKIGSVT